jgi:CoA-transferase family III
VREVAVRLWSLLGGEPSTLDRLELVGERRVLPSVFDVTALATAAVAVANLAVAEFAAARAERDLEMVRVTTREAAAAFRCEALFVPEGWKLPPIRDPIAGDYQGTDGWVRLHTNYAHHRAAVLRALEVEDPARETVAAKVARRSVKDLETRVIEEGGAAAVMHTRDHWLAHPQGLATASACPIELTPRCRRSSRSLSPSARPLSGVNVLDLTRVLAGPFATRFLAAWGAEVLRIDPPGFEEVPTIVPESTAGKRCAFLDLAQRDGRARFLELVEEADVLVHGYRPGALDALGLGNDLLQEANPDLIISQHNAYGWTGPWAGRRGFDSLVQMSCGIAAARGDDRPRPLPAQALDHSVGMLIAAAVCRALTARADTGVSSDIHGSLIGAANLLCDLPDTKSMSIEPPSFSIEDTEPRQTWWGRARAAPIPGCIGDLRPDLPVEPGPLGRDRPAFSSLST